MQISGHHLCLAVLLALLIGHASVAVHAASHTASDALDCELCISYGDSSEALTGEPQHSIRPARQEQIQAGSSAQPATGYYVSYLQRAPPASG